MVETIRLAPLGDPLSNDGVSIAKELPAKATAYFTAGDASRRGRVLRPQVVRDPRREYL